MCSKPKFGFDSVFENRTIQKFDIRSGGFPTETACNLSFKKKINKSNFTRVNVHIKNVLKHDRNRV